MVIKKSSKLRAKTTRRTKKFSFDRFSEYQGARQIRVDSNTVARWDSKKKEYRTVFTDRKETNRGIEIHQEEGRRFTFFSASGGLGSKIELLYQGIGVDPIFFSNNILGQQIWLDIARKEMSESIYDYLGPKYDGWIQLELLFEIINEYLGLGAKSKDFKAVDFRTVYPNWQFRWEIGWVGYQLRRNKRGKLEKMRYSIIKEQKGAQRGTPPNKDPEYKDLRKPKNER